MKLVRKSITNALPAHALIAMLSVSPYAAYGDDDNALNLNELTEFSDTYAQNNPPLNIDTSKAPPVYISVDDQGRPYSLQISYDDNNGYSFVKRYLTDEELAELRATLKEESGIFDEGSDVILVKEGTLTPWFPEVGLENLQNGTEAGISLAVGQWKPVCVEGAVCNANFQSYGGGGAGGYSPIDQHAAGPLPAGRHIWFQYPPQALDPQLVHISDNSSVFRMDTLTGNVERSTDQSWMFISDVNSIGLSNGSRLTFYLYGLTELSEEGEIIEARNWSGLSVFDLNNAALITPPIEVMGTLYIGIRGSGRSSIYHSTDNGQTWTPKGSNIRIGDDRYNLMTNPEQTGLWAINSEFFEQPASLWESIDDGATWAQVDNGSFPENTVRIVHDPDDAQISYALTSEGLYISTNRGIDWRSTLLLGEAVHGMVFIDRTPPLSRALVVGTDSGVKINADEGNSWLDMNKGLLNIPHTVTYHNGVLVASSDAGYFTCNGVDCGGEAQAVPTQEERGLVTVTEFYNTELGHYFMTPSEDEANGIDQGSAGPGWVRTGETFQAWNLLGSNSAANVCRLYGSVTPGPNSHFFTLSTQECSSLLELEQTTPATKPRWNFEQYSFMAIPPAMKGPQSCPDDSQPVYRAYNGGFARGEDSNHRYVTDPVLLEPMVLEGWIDEGVVFCAALPAAM